MISAVKLAILVGICAAVFVPMFARRRGQNCSPRRGGAAIALLIVAAIFVGLLLLVGFAYTVRQQVEVKTVITPAGTSVIAMSNDGDQPTAVIDQPTNGWVDF